MKLAREQKCKVIAEGCGLIWVDWPASCGGSYTYLDGEKCTFQHPEELIRAIDKLPSAKLFWAVLTYGDKPNVEAIDDIGYIDRDYITEPDKLFNECYQWIAERGEGK